MSSVQGVAAGYVPYGYNQVMVRSHRVNIFKTHQLFVLLEGTEVKHTRQPIGHECSISLQFVFNL